MYKVLHELLCIHCEPLANIYTYTAKVLRVDVNLKPSATHKTYWLSFVRALTHVPVDKKTNEHNKEVKRKQMSMIKKHFSGYSSR